MASTYSPLKIELIGTGEQAGTWGSTTNTNLGTAIEQAIGGKADITMSSTSETLTLTNTNAAQDARALYLNLTGTPGGAATLNVPGVEKAYIVKNGTTGGFAVTVKVTGQTGVSVPNGATMHLYNNGTDVVNALTNLPAGATIGGSPIGTGAGTVTSVSGTGTVQGLTLSGTVTSSGNLTLGGSLSAVNLASQVTGTLPIANGGTGATTSTAAINALLPSQSGNSGRYLTTNGTNTSWATVTGGVTSVTASSPLASSGGTTPNISFTGTLGATNGGTAQSTWTTGDLLYASGSNTLTKRAIGTTGQVLTVSAGVPTWATLTAGDVTGAANSVDNGVVLFSGTGGKTLKSSAAQDGFIYGVRIGRGVGGISTNTALGSFVLNSNTTGNSNTAVGYQSLAYNTTGASNTAVGYNALVSNVGASNNVAVGSRALELTTSGGNNVAIGATTLLSNTTGAGNTAIGDSALQSSTTAADNTAVGRIAGISITTGGSNVAIGATALDALTTGLFSTAVGVGALGASTATGNTNNTAVGFNALNAATSGVNNTGLGASALLNLTTGSGNIGVGNRNSSGTFAPTFDVTTENNRLVMGHTGITNAYVEVAWTVTSDGRDKEDVEDAPYGLNFVSRLRPVQYKWDKRSSYYETTEDGEVIKHPKDGSKKEEKIQLGFIAQEVIALEKEFGSESPLIGDDEQEEMLKVTETKFIPVLVKAIQELKAELDSVKAELAALKG